MKTDKTGEFSMHVYKRITTFALVPLVTLLLAACDTDKPTTVQDSINTTPPSSSDYDLSESVVPFPNDILFNGSTDGTVNIPVEDESDLADPQVAINGLDGFSTVAPMSTGFSAAIDPASISGTSVRVFEVVKSGGIIPQASPVTSVTSQLTFGQDYIATVSSVDPTGTTLVIVPLKPLIARTSYAVVVTDALTDTNGNPFSSSISYLLTSGPDPIADLTAVAPFTADDIFVGVLRPDDGATQAEIDEAYADAADLEALRQFIVIPSEQVLLADPGNADITADNVILHWTFTTQSTTDVLDATRTQNRGLIAASGFLPTPVTPSPLGAADIHVGSLQVPYYLEVSDTSSSPSSDPTALGSFWKDGAGGNLSYLLGNVAPASTSTETIPMLVSIPRSIGLCAGGMPVTGWPVVIFQHGITRTRADMLAVADSLAQACIAVVAIDMPMHGITGNETDGSAAFKDPVNGERTFDLDLVTQDADGNIIAQTPDGVIDSSGLHYINLTNLLNTRDNLRQSVSDLFALAWAIESGVVTDGSNIMDVNRIYFLGHSLGAIVGTTFLAVEDPAIVRDAALAFGGASVAKIIDGSATFGPTIRAGLAANGIEKGTPDYEAFVGAAQTVVDSGDPVNHAVDAGIGRGILFFEIVGDGTPNNPSDLVVPNTVPDGNDTSGTVPAPLAGTEPQLLLMGLTQFNSSTAGTDLQVVTKYISGEHGSLLDPTPNPAVTTEIQTQAANFLASDGAALVVTDPSVLQAP